MSRLPGLGPRGEGWVVLQGVLLAAVAVAGVLGPAWAGMARTVTSVVGVAGIAGGLALAVRGIRDLGSALTPLPHPLPGADLVVTGVYGLVRHPIYGGLVIAGVGWGLLTASPPALLAAVSLWGFFELKSRREEAWLETQFAGYAAYKTRTRRLIPWIG
jgi:protein-S-isoprenylcysteine O-methyltransferase Ste14